MRRGANPASLANLIPGPGGAVNVRHGLGVKTLLPCRRCPVHDSCERCDLEGLCGLEAEFITDRLRQLRSLPDVTETEEPMLQRLVSVEVLAARGLRFLMLLGGFRLVGKDLKAEACMSEVRALAASADRMLAELGATPAARARMKSDQSGPAAVWAEGLRRLREAEAVSENAD